MLGGLYALLLRGGAVVVRYHAGSSIWLKGPHVFAAYLVLVGVTRIGRSPGSPPLGRDDDVGERWLLQSLVFERVLGRTYCPAARTSASRLRCPERAPRGLLADSRRIPDGALERA